MQETTETTESTETNKTDRIEGKIKTFDVAKRHGFIEREGDTDVFVHIDAMQGNQTRKLNVGDRVQYVVEEGPKGPRAASLRVIN